VPQCLEILTLTKGAVDRRIECGCAASAEVGGGERLHHADMANRAGEVRLIAAGGPLLSAQGALLLLQLHPLSH